MSHDPLQSVRRRTPRQPSTFPNARYRETVLDPLERWSLDHLGAYALDAWITHALVLVESQSIRQLDGAEAIAVLLDYREGELESTGSFVHPLIAIEEIAVSPSGGVLRLGTATDEIVACSARSSIRLRILDLAEAVLAIRSALSELATQHLTTNLVVTSNGQSVQPTSLAHYLLAQSAPLARSCDRLRQCFDRINSSPAGAVSGVSTAVPINRRRSAELLGFDAVIENTLDALGATDWLDEATALGSSIAGIASRFVADLAQWSRDDLGVVIPGAGFVHRGTTQPQRNDPLVIDHLRSGLAGCATVPAVLNSQLLHRQMIGGTSSLIEAVRKVDVDLHNLVELLNLLAEVVSDLDVNRSLLATRTNRGLSTSSELAELLAIDYKLPVSQAFDLAAQIVAEALLSGIDSTTLRPDLVDRVAMRDIGREIGIEPELLSRCLSPKRFIERRAVIGGPAPAAVSESIERESLARRQHAAWIRERRIAIEAARRNLRERARELARGSDQPDG